MKTTEEEEQQNEIKLAYERNGMDKQTKISKSGPKTLAISNKNTTSQKKICNFCKELKCTVYISMF